MYIYISIHGYTHMYTYNYSVVYVVIYHTTGSWKIHIYIYIYIYTYTLIYTYNYSLAYVVIYHTTGSWYIYIHTRIHPPAPMNHVKTFKVWPPRDAPSKLVQLWYKTFTPDQRGQAEMKKSTRLSNKPSTAWSCAEDQILENKNLRNMILNICTERWVKYFLKSIYL